jgi:hypothetical protein
VVIACVSTGSDIAAMASRAGPHRVAAAFAHERDARYAVRLASDAMPAAVEFVLRPIVGESGYVQMLVLEASFAEPSLRDRLLTVMRGAHGVPVATDLPDAAQAG